VEQGQHCAYNETTDRLLGANLVACDPSYANMAEWIPMLKATPGIRTWMAPVRESPSAGERATFDLVYLDKNCRVVEVVEFLSAPPPAPTSPEAASVLALPACSVQSSQTQLGDQLMLCAAEEVLWRLKRFSYCREVACAVPSVVRDSDVVTQELLWNSSPKSQPFAELDEQGARGAYTVRRSESQRTRNNALVESERKNVKQPNSWLTRWIFPDTTEKRRTPRRSAPGLAAFFWTGGSPQSHIIRDISATGLYAVTDERWYPGTLIRMTLTMVDHRERSGRRSITVQAQAVRWGNDGVGLQFVLQSPQDLRQQQSSRFDGTDWNRLEQFLKRLHLLSTIVTPVLPKCTEGSHSSPVNLVRNMCRYVRAHTLQFSFIQKLRRFSGVDLGDLRVNKWALLLAGISVIAPPGVPSASGQTLDLTQKSLEDLMSITVTSVSKKEQKTSQAAAAVFVISREDIGRSGALNIPDLLRMVPGLDVAQIDSGNWAISARGFNSQYSNKLLVLIDGRTVYSPLFAGVFWDSQYVSLENIERIEVIRGPGSAVWGSNAVNGVINIITRNAGDTQGGHLVAGAGNDSVGPDSIGYGGKARAIGDYRVSAQGFNLSALPTLARLPGQDDWRFVRGAFRTDTTLSARDALTTEGEAYTGNAGEIAIVAVSLAPPENPTLALRERFTGWNLLTRWNRTISPGSATSLQVYFDRTTRGDSTYGVGLNTADIDFQHHIAWGTRQDIVWGLGYRLTSDEIAPDFRISAVPRSRDTQLFSSFAQDEIAIVPDRVHLSLGARLEHNDYSGFNFQPSARMVWTPDRKNSVWAAVSGADRTPDRSDTSFRINVEVLPGSPQTGNLPVLVSLLPSPNEKNEQLKAFETGYRTILTSRFSLDTTAFYNRYLDLQSIQPGAARIETTPAPVHLLIPQSFGNSIYGETHGIEAFSNLKITSFWTLNPGYTFFSMHLHEFAGSQDASIPGIQGGTPDHQAQLRSSISLPHNLQWNASAYFVNRLPAQSIPSYTRFDTGLNWLVGERTSLSVVGQNLFKDLHPEFEGITTTVQSGLMRRAVYGKMTWLF